MKIVLHENTSNRAKIILAKTMPFYTWNAYVEKLIAHLGGPKEVYIMDRIAELTGLNPKKYDNHAYGDYLNIIHAELQKCDVVVEIRED